MVSIVVGAMPASRAQGRSIEVDLCLLRKAPTEVVVAYSAKLCCLKMRFDDNCKHLYIGKIALYNRQKVVTIIIHN